MISVPLFATPTNEYGMAALVYRNTKDGFNVVLRDVDADENVPFVTTFPELVDAIGHANDLVAEQNVKGLVISV